MAVARFFDQLAEKSERLVYRAPIAGVHTLPDRERRDGSLRTTWVGEALAA